MKRKKDRPRIFIILAIFLLLFIASNFPMAFAPSRWRIIFLIKYTPYYCILLAFAISHYWKKPTVIRFSFFKLKSSAFAMIGIIFSDYIFSVHWL